MTLTTPLVLPPFFVFHSPRFSNGSMVQCMVLVGMVVPYHNNGPTGIVWYNTIPLPYLLYIPYHTIATCVDNNNFEFGRQFHVALGLM